MGYDIFTAQFNAVSVSAQQDLLSIVAPTSQLVIIHEIGFSQTSKAGDANEVDWLLLIKSGQTVAGSGGTSVTGRNFSGTAANSTCRANDTTKANSGTIITHYPDAWNIRVSYCKVWTPETRPILPPSRRMTFELATTPGSATTCNGYVVFQELG
jgi:hypothetical protein